MQEDSMTEDIEDNGLNALTPYQLKFVDEYMKCGNKRKALLVSGYKGKRSTVTSYI